MEKDKKTSQSQDIGLTYWFTKDEGEKRLLAISHEIGRFDFDRTLEVINEEFPRLEGNLYVSFKGAEFRFGELKNKIKVPPIAGTNDGEECQLKNIVKKIYKQAKELDRVMWGGKYREIDPNENLEYVPYEELLIDASEVLKIIKEAAEMYEARVCQLQT